MANNECEVNNIVKTSRSEQLAQIVREVMNQVFLQAVTHNNHAVVYLPEIRVTRKILLTIGISDQRSSTLDLLLSTTGASCQLNSILYNAHTYEQHGVLFIQPLL